MQLNGQFEFISSHGRLLQAHADNGEMHASQEVGNIGQEERWNVYSIRPGVISIQNVSNNKWLCAEENGRAVCDRDNPSIWEEWTLFAGGDGHTVCLRSYHGKWLCAQPPDDDTQFGGEVIADRDNAGEWERFTMVPSAQLQGSGSNWFNIVTQAVTAAGTLVEIFA